MRPQPDLTPDQIKSAVRLLSYEERLELAEYIKMLNESAHSYPSESSDADDTPCILSDPEHEAVEQGLRQADAGLLVPAEEVFAKYDVWRIKSFTQYKHKES